MTHPIYIYGHPILRKVAEDIDKDYKDRNADDNKEPAADNFRYVGILGGFHHISSCDKVYFSQ